MTRGDSSSDHIAEEGQNPFDEAGSDSESEAWWRGSQASGEDDYDPEVAVFSKG